MPALCIVSLAQAESAAAPVLADLTPAAALPGLYVRDGVLMKDGRAYRGVGANYFSLFSRMIKDPADTTSLANLKVLHEAGIPFVRFMCGGYWPVEQKLYLANREEYFRRLDQVVRAAEASGTGLIPSLFWYYAMAPDTVGEPVDQYGNPDSKTVALVRRYTAEIVERYKDSPAIWGWEFGNEYNLDADLPEHQRYRPACQPQLGTPKERTARDELKFPQVRTAYVAFAETVRKFDRTRLIISGNAIPRPAAWHNVNEKSWALDTEAQFAEILRRDNPDPMNTISVHLYRDAKGVYPGGAGSIDEFLGLAMKHAAGAGKPLFLGEFGTDRQAGPREKQQAIFEEFLAAIEKHRVPLAAFWVFDYDGQDTDWNVTFRNDRSFMIDLVSRLNARLGAK